MFVRGFVGSSLHFVITRMLLFFDMQKFKVQNGCAVHGAGQVFIRTSFCTDKLRLHGTGQIFVRFAFPFTRCLI